MKSLLPLIVSLLFYFYSSSQDLRPFTTCPNVNIAVARAGSNADVQNPYFIYSVNTATGAVSQYPGGPLLHPTVANQNLQVNGIGVNTTDGLLYGLETETSGSNPKLVRFDYAYHVSLLGGVAPPTSATGFFGIVNTAAGDVDRSNNYYFTGFTANSAPNGFTLDKLFLGKIAGLSTLAGVPIPTYYEIDVSDANCGNYIATLNTDPVNSGIKDISFNPTTGTFFIYATYKPTGAANFSGQLLELKPIAGSSPLKYKMFCKDVINTHSAETAGSLIDNAGNILVLLTDGSMGKLSISGGAYTGVYTPLNNATGLPNQLRGDMGSCGGPTGGPTPVKLSSFKASTRDCKTNIVWTSETEINLKQFELQQSFDNVLFTSVETISANNRSGSTYELTLSSTGNTAYYRLKMVDNDKNASYSDILVIKNTCTTPAFGFTLRANPVTDVIKMNWYGMNATTMNVKIYNAYGVMVFSNNVALPSGSSLQNIDAGTLPPGVYVIKAFDTKTNVNVEKRFVKQ